MIKSAICLFLSRWLSEGVSLLKGEMGTFGLRVTVCQNVDWNSSESVANPHVSQRVGLHKRLRQWFKLRQYLWGVQELRHFLSGHAKLTAVQLP